MSHEFTMDSELLKSPIYHKIKDIVKKLSQVTTPEQFAGNCISTADIVQHLLSHAGIKCKIVECQVCLIRTDGQSQDFLFIGYDGRSYAGQIDTHTVVITEDEEPLLIDLSLGHVMPKDKPFIIEKLNGAKPGTISEFNIGNINITYTEKKSVRLPAVHQKTLLQRIVNEQEMTKSISNLKLFVICAVSLGLVNFTLNVILIVLRLYNVTWVD